MKFQIYSQSSDCEHATAGSNTPKPHADAEWDAENYLWSIEVRDLDHLLKLGKSTPVMVMFDPIMPVLVLLDDAQAADNAR